MCSEYNEYCIHVGREYKYYTMDSKALPLYSPPRIQVERSQIKSRIFLPQPYLRRLQGVNWLDLRRASVSYIAVHGAIGPLVYLTCHASSVHR